MLVDSHCHLLGSYTKGKRVDEVLARARSSGVTGFIAVGTNLHESSLVLDFAAKNIDIQASLGVHPHEAKTWNEGTFEALQALAANPSCRFIGEAGLDWHYDFSPRETQEAVFRAQIRLAKITGKPLMIHTREAPDETVRILREEGAETVRGIIHCFSENKAFAEKVLDLGFYLSFSGIVTFKKAEAVQNVAAWAPLDRILVETDAPFLAPTPHRGKTNEPAFVTLVAAEVARLRGISASTLAERTTRNLEDLCGWAPSS